MRILLQSCHGVLEFDETRLLTEMGHEVFCLGDVHGNERPLIAGARDVRCPWIAPHELQELHQRGQGDLPEWLLDRVDAIVCMHLTEWLKPQWARIRKKKCLLRLIGQHSKGLGASIRPMTDDGLIVLQYWPSDAEHNGLSAAQAGHVVRFYKDEEEFKGWTGEIPMVLTVNNDINRGGGHACHASEYRQATDGLPRLLVGKENRFFGDFTARLPYFMLKEAYRRHRVYLFMNTEPCTYVLNLMEAMMTGMPIIAYDNGRGVRDMVPFASNDPEELREMLEGLLAKDPSELAVHCRRDQAIKMFGRQQAIDSWKAVLS